MITRPGPGSKSFRERAARGVTVLWHNSQRTEMNRFMALFTVGTFLGGLLLGVVIGRRGQERNTEPESTRTQQPHPAAPRIPEGPAVLREMQEEILGLRRRLRDLERQGGVPATPDRRAQVAEEIYRDLADPRSHEDVKRWLRNSGRLADLDPSMAPYFIAKYREKQPNGDAMALELAIGCGGPEVVALLKEIFGNPGTPALARHLAGVSMTGMGLVSQMWPDYSPDPALTELAGRYVGSSDPADRRGAIGLLRLQPGDSSRAQLQFIVSNDQDGMIRMAAVTALASVGDQSTMTFLHQYATRAAPKLFESDSDKDYTPLEYTLQHTLETLRRKFPE